MLTPEGYTPTELPTLYHCTVPLGEIWVIQPSSIFVFFNSFISAHNACSPVGLIRPSCGLIKGVFITCLPNFIYDFLKLYLIKKSSSRCRSFLLDCAVWSNCPISYRFIMFVNESGFVRSEDDRFQM